MTRPHASRAHKTNTQGLSAAEFERLTTWMPEIAGAVLGPIQPDGDGFRVGDNRALVINADASFHDFRDGKHGHGPLALLRHLHGPMSMSSAMPGSGSPLITARASCPARRGADGGDAEADISRQAMIDACGRRAADRRHAGRNLSRRPWAQSQR